MLEHGPRNADVIGELRTTQGLIGNVGERTRKRPDRLLREQPDWNCNSLVILKKSRVKITDFRPLRSAKCRA